MVSSKMSGMDTFFSLGAASLPDLVQLVAALTLL